MEKCERKTIQATNRELCLDWCRENNLVHQNSHFQKPIEKKISYRDIGTDPTDKELNWEKFAELDHCFSTRKWRNSIQDIETNRKIHTDSNHYPMIIKYRRKFAEEKEKENEGKGRKRKR